MKNAYPAVAPKPTSEKQDDNATKLIFAPNGDDVSRYNLGHGNRRVGPVFDPERGHAWD